MEVMNHVLKKQYRDSVALMQTSSSLAQISGLNQISIVMGSEANISLLQESGLAGADLMNSEAKPGPNDLIIAVKGVDQAVLSTAIEQAVELLMQATADSGTEDIGSKQEAMCLSAGLAEAPETNLAIIATPGEYAAAEAKKALNLGLNTMIFSDNVSIEEELALKKLAIQKDLLVMGPDCGTAIIDGVPLAFANVVNRGPIGVIGASGTGIQQITSLIDSLGSGISHAIGTGGHDLSQEVGGLSMKQGLKLFCNDPKTEVIVMVSKPPAPEVEQEVLSEAAATGKTVIVNFIGSSLGKYEDSEALIFAKNLEEAAVLAVSKALDKPANQLELPQPEPYQAKFSSNQRWLRGIYTGGTFCFEATFLLEKRLGQVHSNTPVGKKSSLLDPWQSQEHTLIDMGDDLFTRGRAHPMIDPSFRLDRIKQEARDPETAVILFDVVLGHGAHADPAKELVEVITTAQKEALKEGRDLIFVGFVCGTKQDPQNLQKQLNQLQQAGVLLAPSNAKAVELAENLIAAI